MITLLIAIVARVGAWYSQALTQHTSIKRFGLAWVTALFVAMLVLVPMLLGLVWVITWLLFEHPLVILVMLLGWILVEAAWHAHRNFPDPERSQAEGALREQRAAKAAEYERAMRLKLGRPRR